MLTKCSVQDCDSTAEHRRLCGKHYKRWQRYGSPDVVHRPEDWGERGRDPLHVVWKHLTRKAQTGQCQIVPSWSDFKEFVRDVGVHPNPENSKLKFKQKVRDEPFGPQNFLWREVDPIPPKRTPEYRAYREKYHRKNRDRRIQRKYGITLDRYEELLTRQKHRCAICQKPERRQQGNGTVFSLAIDHSRASGLVRGLLCSDCNRGLGFFEDNPKYLEAAAKYLRSHAKRLRS